MVSASELGQVQHIDRLPLSGEGIGIGAEGKTLSLKDLNHLAIGHMRGAFKRHMLQKMSKTLLCVAFSKRAGCDAEAKRDLPSGRCIFHKGVSHTIRQRSEQYCRIGLKIARALRPDRGLGILDCLKS